MNSKTATTANTKISRSAKCFLMVYRALFLCVQSLLLALSPLSALLCTRIKDGFFNYLGFVPKIRHRGNTRLFWVHAVSVGESTAALGFCKELKKNFPNAKIVLSTTHPDVISNMRKKDIFAAVFYFPLDTVSAMNKAFNRLKPNAAFVCETDFWPEFSYQCKKRQVQLFLINGRISYKIRDFYIKLQALSEIVFGSYTKLFVQTKSDAESLYRLNADKDRVCIAGNIKADLTQNAKHVDLTSVKSWASNRKCFVYGSLHPEEFNLILPTLKSLVSKNISVIIAPRKLSDAASWKTQIQNAGMSACLKSEGPVFSDIMLLNTMGELSSVYKLAAASFVGGSLKTDVGGHNPLEVIAQNVPVLMGDRCRNFEDLTSQLLENNAMIQCKTELDIINGFNKILAEPGFAAQMAARAALVLNKNKGALKKTVESAAVSLTSAR